MNSFNTFHSNVNNGKIVTRYYRVVSAGLLAMSGTVINISGFSANGISPGFYSYTPTNLNGTSLADRSSNTFNRSYNVLIINRITGATTTSTYDVYGGPGTTPLTNYLNSLTSSVIVVIATWDEPKNSGGSSPLPADLVAAIKRCGGSSNFGSDIISFRGAYVLVGIPDNGVNTGIQRFSGQNSANGDPNAAIDLRLSVSNGVFSIISG
jgi:hypothetical protein